MIIIPENTQITSNTDTAQQFLIEDVVDFSFSSSMDPTEVTVYQISGNTPTYFLLKKTRKAISSTIKTETLTFLAPKKFETRNINAPNIIGILDVFDTDANKWYEVPNLAQESVFDTIRNTSFNDPNYSDDTEVPYLLRLKQVQRRFATRFVSSGSLEIQFGAGTQATTDEEIVPNPDNVGLGLPFEKDKMFTAFSPLNFVFTDTYGIVPSNISICKYKI